MMKTWNKGVWKDATKVQMLYGKKLELKDIPSTGYGEQNYIYYM